MRHRNVAAIICVCSCAAIIARGQESGFALGVAAGDVTSENAILWTRAGEPSVVRLVVSVDADFSTTAFITTTQAIEAADLTIKVVAGGLLPATDYYYRFSRYDQPEVRSATGRFRTAPSDGTDAPLRFIFSGDSNFRYAPFGVMSAAAQEGAELFLWFGDTIYSDVSAGGLGRATSLDDYRAKYRQVRGDPHARELLASMALRAGWDDHEVRNDYAGRDPALSAVQRDAGYQAFFEYMPIARQEASGNENRTYRSFRHGSQVEFFMLDGRQYRDPSAEEACGGHLDPTGFVVGPLLDDDVCTDELAAPRSMLGAEQFAWLTAGLAASTARVKFVVNDVPLSFMGVYPYDRWDGYDAERRDLLEFIDANGIGGVVFLTTDIHANAYNPDVCSFFRRFRPDYSLPNGVPVAELVVGPIGNETARQSIYGIVGEIVGGALAGGGTIDVSGEADLGGAAVGSSSPLVAFALRSAERGFEDRLIAANGLKMIQTDRVSYAVIDVSAAGDVHVTYRGVPAERANNDDVGIETFYEADVSAARVPVSPCGLGTLLALGLVTGGLASRRHVYTPKTRSDAGAERVID